LVFADFTFDLVFRTKIGYVFIGRNFLIVNLKNYITQKSHKNVSSSSSALEQASWAHPWQLEHCIQPSPDFDSKIQSVAENTCFIFFSFIF
jgi:hypothetical protein